MVGIPSSGPRRHVGDIMSQEKRSAVMARIKGKNTKPELAMAAALAAHGLQWENHVRDLPGRPDFVFRAGNVVVFVDGDFWHGWRFPQWRDKLSKKWEAKIETTRRRDARNHRTLRRMGWTIVRIWEHQVTANIEACVAKVLLTIQKAKSCEGSTWSGAGEPDREET